MIWWGARNGRFLLLACFVVALLFDSMSWDLLLCFGNSSLFVAILFLLLFLLFRGDGGGGGGGCCCFGGSQKISNISVHYKI